MKKSISYFATTLILNFCASAADTSPFKQMEFLSTYHYYNIKHEVSLPNESRNYLSENLPGGSVTLSTTYWLPDSQWGGALIGIFGGFNTKDAITIATGDITLAAQYKIFQSHDNAQRLKGYFGIRSWTMPLLRSAPISVGGVSRNFTDVFGVSLVGVMGGLQSSTRFSENWIFSIEVEGSTPIAHSTMGNGIKDTYNNDHILSHREEVSIKRNLGEPSTWLVLSVGNQEDIFQWAASGTGSTSYVKTSAPMVGIGVETTTDFWSEEFQKNDPRSSLHAFSEFSLSTKYIYNPSWYHSNLHENLPLADYSVTGTVSGTRELVGYGWFKNSRWGIRSVSSWAGFILGPDSYTFPQYWLQVGTKVKGPWDLTFHNFFGVRAWTIPVITMDTTITGNINASMPTLVGPAETFIIEKPLGQGWASRLLMEISCPLLEASHNNFARGPDWRVMSSKFELFASRKLTDYFSMSGGLGVKQDQYSYVAFPDNDASSTVTLNSMLVSIAGTFTL